MMDPGTLVLFIPVILWALSFHELGHAWVALRFGDPTARNQGRVSLNPLRHLDPFGTLMMFVAGFGWARPVPVDPRNLRDPLRDGLWIAAAGPGANLLSALAAGLLLQALVKIDLLSGLLGGSGYAVSRLLELAVQVNLALAVFNLIPLYPLDGAAVLKGLVSERTAFSLARLDPFGPMVLMLVLFAGRTGGFDPLGWFMTPVIGTLRHLVSGGVL